MEPLHGLDDAYERLAASLPTELATTARNLAFTLKLVPTPGIPWTHVFGQEVTLGAPALFAEAWPDAPPPVVADASFAQMLALIEAFGTDRLEDGQVAPTTELHALLAALRDTRNQTLARVCGESWPPDGDPHAADRATLAAIAAERTLLHARRPTTFSTYERISLGKQRVCFPATMCLAAAVGLDAEACALVHRALTSIWLNLQLPDDVVDWEEDLRSGGAWAVSLALAHVEPGDRARVLADTAKLHAVVERSGVLVRMLRRAAWHAWRVATLARTLGAMRLAAWAERRRVRHLATADEESRSPGFARREFVLIPWRLEVLG